MPEKLENARECLSVELFIRFRTWTRKTKRFENVTWARVHLQETTCFHACVTRGFLCKWELLQEWCLTQKKSNKSKARSKMRVLRGDDEDNRQVLLWSNKVNRTAENVDYESCITKYSKFLLILSLISYKLVRSPFWNYAWNRCSRLVDCCSWTGWTGYEALRCRFHIVFKFSVFKLSRPHVSV